MFKHCSFSFFITFVLVTIVDISFSQTILGTIPIPDGEVPTSVFYIAETQKLYSANLWHTNMSVVDVTNRNIEATVPMPGAWMACLFVGVDKDNNRIYLGDVTGKTVVLSGDDYSLITTLYGILGIGFARDSVQDKNYIAASPDIIYVLEGSTSTILDSIETGEFEISFVNANNLCFDADNGLLYAACNKEKKIDIIDCGPDTLLTSIPINLDTLPSAIDINCTTGRLYVSCDSSVVVVDGVTQQVLTTIFLEGHPTDLSVDEVNDKVYIAMEDTHALVIDGGTNAVDDTIPFSTTFIQCDPSGNEIYLILGHESILEIISIPDYSLLETIILHYRLDDLAIDESRNLLFVAATTRADNNFVFKIDCNTDSIIDTLHVSDEAPYTIYLGYDEALQKIYFAERGVMKLYCIDAEFMTLISSHDLPDNPMHFNANPITNKVYIPMLNSAQLLVFDGAGDSIETFVNIHSAPIDAEVNLLTNKVFVSTESWYLDVVDGATNQVDTSIYLTSGPLLESNCVNDLVNEIYVCSFSGQDVTILDGNQNYAIITTIPFDHVMRDGVANESTNRIFVHDADNHIYIIDGETHEIVDTITIFKEETRLAVNTEHGIIYASDFGGILIIQDDATGITTESQNKIGICSKIELICYPNPFRNKVDISFSIGHPDRITHSSYGTGSAERIELRIYDVSGRIVKSFDLASGVLPLAFAVFWNGVDNSGNRVPPGVYFCRLRVDDKALTTKVIKLID
ncbi:T9SS type A sorting domain-containing protein [candidate division WOR-3 bacterium]|nr:T9SS type A sorting domain-containing protein [candidate division WOR-3 bacterium]